jgi:23S rRNA pseudouridine1911/1915/1917 synthase
MNLKECLLFEDNHLFILNKPSGVSVLPNEGMLDLLTISKDFLKKRDQKEGGVFLHPVHRIDRWVSGIVVFAKTSKALSRLNEQIREKLWKKIYIAELVKKLPTDKGILTHYIRKRQFLAEVFDKKVPHSKQALLKFSHICDHFYHIELDTGRYHQIRGQMSFMKCPIVGDQKYGAPKRESKAIHLHHTTLSFPHPITKNLLVIDSKPLFI